MEKSKLRQWESKMAHEELLERVKEVVDELFADDSVDQETTRESLEDVIEHIVTMLDSI